MLIMQNMNTFSKVKITQKIHIPSVSFPPSFSPFLRGSHLQCFLECFPVFSFCNDKQIYVWVFFFLPQLLTSKRVYLQCRRFKLSHWVGKIPWRRKQQLTLVFLPEKSHGQRSLAGYSPKSGHGLDRTEQQQQQHRFIMCTHHRLFRQFPLCGQYLGCFQYFAVKNVAAMNNLVKIYFHILGGIYLQDTFLEVRLLGWRVNVYVVFVRCCLITLHKHYAIWIHTSHV